MPEHRPDRGAMSDNDSADHATTQPIALHERGDIDAFLEGGQRRQPMAGFDDDFTDIVDYIIRATHRIWEEGGMGLIYSYYQHNVRVHTSTGLVYGREEMLAASMQKLAAYPDRKAYGDEVVWAGDDNGGFHTSHRLVSVAHNTGWSRYGPPTNRKVVSRTIAHCVVRENRIMEEWLATDELHVVRQLGLDPWDAARALARERPDSAHTATGPVLRTHGQGAPRTPPPTGDDVEDLVRTAIDQVWNWRLFNRIEDFYSPTYVAMVPPGRTLRGHGEYQGWVVALIAAFPDALLAVDDLYWMPDGDDGARTAVRWTLTGTHTGFGPYGRPTGRRVKVMGFTQHVVRNGSLVTEYTVFDELALMSQLVEPDARSVGDGA